MEKKKNWVSSSLVHFPCSLLFHHRIQHNTNEPIHPHHYNHSAFLLKCLASIFQYLSIHPFSSSTLPSLQRFFFHLQTICNYRHTLPFFNFNQQRKTDFPTHLIQRQFPYLMILGEQEMASPWSSPNALPSLTLSPSLSLSLSSIVFFFWNAGQRTWRRGEDAS